MKKLFLLFFLIIYGCSKNEESKLESGDNKQAPIKVENSGKIQKTNTILIVKQYADNVDINNQFILPKRGKFIALFIEADNTAGTDDLSLFSSAHFKLQDQNNSIYNAEMVVGKEPKFNALNKIEVGTKMTWWVTFDVPLDFKINGCKIKYELFADKSDLILLENLGNPESANQKENSKLSSNSNEPSNSSNNLYLGDINGKYKIGMEIQINDDNSVTGNYYYISKKIPIRFEGTINNNKISLQISDPALSESFEGTYYGNSISGTWTNGKKTFPFKVLK